MLLREYALANEKTTAQADPIQAPHGRLLRVLVSDHIPLLHNWFHLRDIDAGVHLLIRRIIIPWEEGVYLLLDLLIRHPIRIRNVLPFNQILDLRI